MATMFVQQSQEYIRQIEEEIERLQQLLEQVRVTIHSEEQLNAEEPAYAAPRRPSVDKRAGKKSASKAVAPKKRGRPKKTTEAAEV